MEVFKDLLAQHLAGELLIFGLVWRKLRQRRRQLLHATFQGFGVRLVQAADRKLGIAEVLQRHNRFLPISALIGDIANFKEALCGNLDVFVARGVPANGSTIPADG